MLTKSSAAVATITLCLASAASAQCFDYSQLSGQQSAMSGLSAASCVGYYAATQEKADPATFAQLKNLSADIADTFEDVMCPARDITVGAQGETESKFKAGYDLALSNAVMVQNKAMTLDEFRARVGVCANLTAHYMNEMQKMTR